MGPPLFKAVQVSQFKLRSHMYMYWKVWTVYITDIIWLLSREDGEAADWFIDCFYRLAISPIFTLDLRHKFARSIALSKWTFRKSQIRPNFEQHSGYRFGTCSNDYNWSLEFLPLDRAIRHTYTEIGTHWSWNLTTLHHTPIIIVVPTLVFVFVNCLAGKTALLVISKFLLS